MKAIDSLKPREQVSEKFKWQLQDLFASEADFLAAVEDNRKQADHFERKYKNQLDDISTIIEALEVYNDNKKIADWIKEYAVLHSDTDITNPRNLERSRLAESVLSEIGAKLSFFKSEILAHPEEALAEIGQKAPKYKPYIRRLLLEKQEQLPFEIEEHLAELAPVLNQPLQIFEQIRSNDLDFGTFKVRGEEYPLSFVLYEEYYMYHSDTEIRRASYDQFSKVLQRHQNGMAAVYYTQVKKEKIISEARGYKSVFDYLLVDQEVTREMYDRQIDTIMKDFAPIMRKYITHLKEENDLDVMYYADLKMDLDAKIDKTVDIDQGRDYIEGAIQPLGPDYVATIMQAFNERWIDFSRNKGKRTGASCTSPYGKHPYIILSWADRLDTVYTLIHELGHAGQALFTEKKEPISSVQPSLYITEAYSTFNELLLTDHMISQTENKREERAVWSTMISKTYFHNFVTHLLEAGYQREVYRLVDKKKGFSASDLNRLKREVLEEFWQDTVELEEGAELTWMRQRHYYRGLYPFTYSAGLTISTQAFLNYKENGQEAIDQWLEFLSLGSSLPPVDAARVLGLDMTGNEPLIQTIKYLDQVVDHIIKLSNSLKND
ncbi:MAG: oligoendopeptidase F [Atopococcus tabaci]|uniref:Oligopeptidase F n=1 Tax=Atopococcus tabaci TaxID=269774 RepID=A0AA43UBT2_9LACT|nr:oligoendopeptidase F [Atopococcus tabaci]